MKTKCLHRHLSLTLMMIFAAVLFLLVACAGKSDPEAGAPADARLTIATSFYPMYIMAINVAKDIPGVEVVNITPPVTGCLHDYQLKPDDLKALEKAQIFVINGAGMESFLDKVIDQQPDLHIVEAGKGITMLETNDEGEVNPHLWVGISNNIRQVKNVGEQLAALDPEYVSQYQANTVAYTERLEELRNEARQALGSLTQRDIVTFHEAFSYLALEFNLNNLAVIENEPGSEPKAAELVENIDLVKENGIKVLFAEPQYSRQTVDTIARETGAKVYILDPAATGPMEADAYIKIMKENLNTLTEALSN